MSSSPSTPRREGGGSFSVELVESRPGLLIFRAAGRGARATFQHESGGHRWQRVPPNEKHGRVHTSTVTVAVLNEPAEHELRLDERDLEWQFVRGSGAGGQHRNKTESCAVLTHRPSGLTVRCQSERHQGQNRALALSLLRARLLEAQTSGAARQRNDARRGQIGSGMRGDKVRTVRADGVTDHRLGRRMSLERYVRGHLEELLG